MKSKPLRSHCAACAIGVALIVFAKTGGDTARAEDTDELVTHPGEWRCHSLFGGGAGILIGDKQEGTEVDVVREKNGELRFMFSVLTLKYGQLDDHGWERFTLTVGKHDLSITRTDDSTKFKHHATLSGRIARDVDSLFREGGDATITVYLHGTNEAFKRQTFTLSNYANKINECTR